MSDSKKPKSPDVSSVRIAVGERVGSIDPRAHAAWRTWLAALADDADAATAAALAYESLDAGGRTAWLDALDHDAPEVNVPKIALYAPLLGVEQDDERRERIAKCVEGAAKLSTPPRAIVGTHEGARVCLVVSPLYLHFVEILFCRYLPDEGIREARHQWLAHERDVVKQMNDLGVPMDDVPLPRLVEELAHAVVADRRNGRDAPPELAHYTDLFAPDLMAGDAYE